MYKRLGLIGAALLVVAIASGQTTNTFPASGNVGIGTTSPGTLLQVGSIGANTNKISFPGDYNFENVYLGQYNNGNNGLELINHVNSTQSYGIKLETNADSLVSGLQIQVAPPATSYSALSYSTAMTILASGGNVGVGTTSPSAKLEVDGNLKLTSGSGASITFADGTVQSTAYTGVACGGDFAESVDVTGNRKQFSPGDVLVADPNHPGKFLKSSTPYSTAVLGVFSTKPGFVGRRLTGPKGPNEIPMAMVGIVPTHVTAMNGPIHVGDLLVASSISGYAMKGTNRSRMLGAVIGKALGNLKSGKGTIEVGITLQ